MKVGTFLVFGILLVMSFYEEIQALCDPNGCSIPFNLPYFYKKRFTPACNKHDVCYACVRYISSTLHTNDMQNPVVLF